MPIDNVLLILKELCLIPAAAAISAVVVLA